METTFVWDKLTGIFTNFAAHRQLHHCTWRRKWAHIMNCLLRDFCKCATATTELHFVAFWDKCRQSHLKNWARKKRRLKLTWICQSKRRKSLCNEQWAVRMSKVTAIRDCCPSCLVSVSAKSHTNANVIAVPNSKNIVHKCPNDAARLYIIFYFYQQTLHFKKSELIISVLTK